MPTYDFECQKCGIVEVYVRPFDSDERPLCQRCGEPTVRKFPIPTFVFRGDGWAKKERSAKPE